MDSRNLQRGARGDDVRVLQMKLHRLGFDLAADGVYGVDTERSVRRLQALFGHRDDGVVSDATWRLIEAELRAGWNAQLPNAEELAIRAQALAPPDEPAEVRPRRESSHEPDELPSVPSVPDARRTAVPPGPPRPTPRR